MDAKLVADPNDLLAQTVAGMAFMEPQFDITRLRSEKLVASLCARAQVWVKSDSQPKGEIVTITTSHGEKGAEMGLKQFDEGPQNSHNSETGPQTIPTFSSGVDIDELIWPAVMDDVLAFFQRSAAKINEAKHTATQDALEKMGFEQLERMK